MSPVAPLWQGRRVAVCVGTGGVGKTTTAAALSVAAACAGLHVMVMTIDPARRLAQIFGLPTDPQKDLASAMHKIAASTLAPFGLALKGSLTAYLPDVKATFDALMRHHATGPKAAARIMNNVIYQNFSTALAGSHEYAAVEALYAVHADPAYDLIVLDTPPSQNVVDFLQAPRRIINFLDVGQLPKLLTGPLLQGRLAPKLLGVGEALVSRALGKVVGAQTLADVGAFILSMREMYDGFRQRAGDVEALLHASELAYVLVGTPAPNQQRAMCHFDAELRAFGARADAIILNRVRTPPCAPQDAAALEPEIRRALGAIGPTGAAHANDVTSAILLALADEIAVADHHATALDALTQKWPHARVMALPELPPKESELAALARLAQAFLP